MVEVGELRSGAGVVVLILSSFLHQTSGLVQCVIFVKNMYMLTGL